VLKPRQEVRSVVCVGGLSQLFRAVVAMDDVN